MRLNPRHLDLFRDVVRHNGISRAAEALGIGQPFVTRAIARLERDVGFALFARGRGGVSLTPEGEIFLREVERSQIGLDQLSRAARDIRERGRGLIRIGCLPSLTYSFLPRVLKAFAALRPDVTISVAVRSPETIWSWVASHQCDLGLARPKAGFSGVVAEPFLSLQAVCAVPRRHRLAAKRSVTLADLAGEAMIAAPPGAPHQPRLERLLADAGVQPRVVAETQNSVQRCALVAQGLGVSIVDPVAAREFANPRIALKRFTPAIVIETMLLFPAGRPRNLLTEQLATLLRAEAAVAARNSRPPSSP
ncbi:LysR family transcriptional regulator [Bradyrhizobium sp. 2TAF24]|uniref:LysR family transcriptional regulator n=1 Tax=Bradyrhizobium sp. 2TAF24 TaxID=3233011 RepID=UPI003F8DB671